VDESPYWNLAIALGIGLMLGVERERHKGRGPGRGFAGIRTFALVGLLGGLSMQIGGAAVVAVAGAFVGLAAIVGYSRRHTEDPGMTTVVALVVTFLLGALAQDEPGLAAGAGVAVAVVLAARTRLHAIARDVLTEEELHDGLLFAACALIVLPLVPDEAIGPYDVFNPFTLWRLVVLMMAVSAGGYIGIRVLGPRYGLPLAGFLSGFVSSTMTIATMGTRAREEPGLRRSAVAGATLSTVATVVFTAVLAGATSPAALRELALPLVLAGAAAVIYGGLFAWRAARAAPSGALARGRAFNLRTAVGFAVAISAVLFLSTMLNEELGAAGLVLVTAISGFADAQAAVVAVCSLVAAGRIEPADAVLPILVTLSTNTVSKAVAAAVTGRRRYALQVWPGLVLVIAAAWLGYAVTRLV
jgi:uncharacterized membrane protein (DUF4010 family)